MASLRFLLLLLCFMNALLQWTRGDDNKLNKTSSGTRVFHCPVLAQSSPSPESVHFLRPSDVRVVAALGDSMTAGMAITAKTLPQEMTQNRGLSWSGGGQGTLEEHMTMPNILKKYATHLYGYATGDGREDNVRAHFNLAVPGAVSSDLEKQARKLVKKMKEDSNVDFLNDWKIITVLFGVNDICRYCNYRKDFNAAKYYENLVRGLDVLHAELPRTLVNLVEPLNMSVVNQLNHGLLCTGLHLFVCQCAAFPETKADEAELAEISAQFQKTVKELSLSGRYDTRKDFTVVHQPCLSHTKLPLQGGGQPDMTYFAPDCFHLSAKGHAAAALALWNNMVSPMGQKRTKWTPGENFTCPSEDQPYIFTNRNSAPVSPSRDIDAGSISVQVMTYITVGGLVFFIIAAVVFFALCRRYGKRELYVQIPPSDPRVSGLLYKATVEGNLS